MYLMSIKEEFNRQASVNIKNIYLIIYFFFKNKKIIVFVDRIYGKKYEIR